MNKNGRLYNVWSAVLLFIIMGLQGCEMFEAHPYDTLVRGEKNLNEKHIKRIETTLCGKDTIRFAFISDTQRWYDETKDFVRSINKRQDIDFVLHGGDISDFGATHEFILQRDILLGLRMPWVALLGNHDCLGTGENVFNEIFGTPNFHFVAGKVLFVCLKKLNQKRFLNILKKSVRFHAVQEILRESLTILLSLRLNTILSITVMK